MSIGPARELRADALTQHLLRSLLACRADPNCNSFAVRDQSRRLPHDYMTATTSNCRSHRRREAIACRSAAQHKIATAHVASRDINCQLSSAIYARVSRLTDHVERGREHGFDSGQRDSEIDLRAAPGWAKRRTVAPNGMCAMYPDNIPGICVRALRRRVDPAGQEGGA